MHDEILAASQLIALVARQLHGSFGNNEQRWQDLIGEVQFKPIAFHTRCNWTVRPRATGRERRAIEKVLRDVAAEHPLLRRGI
jgi:hypothetical protein